LSIVKHPLKLVAVDRIGGVGRNKVNMKLAVAAAEDHRVRKLLAAILAR